MRVRICVIDRVSVWVIASVEDCACGGVCAVVVVVGVSGAEFVASIDLPLSCEVCMDRSCMCDMVPCFRETKLSSCGFGLQV